MEAGYSGGDDSTGSDKWAWDTVLAVEIMRSGDSGNFTKFTVAKYV